MEHEGGLRSGPLPRPLPRGGSSPCAQQMLPFGGISFLWFGKRRMLSLEEGIKRNSPLLYLSFF